MIDPGQGILVVATEWESRNGGISTLNRGLCGALVDAGHRVACYVAQASEDELRAAAELDVELVVAPAEQGVDARERLRRRPPIEGFRPTAVIGHGRVTGPAAHHLVREYYLEACLVHVVHTAPEQLEWYKTVEGDIRSVRGDDRLAQERELVRQAHVVCAVGPRLFRIAVDHTEKPSAVVEILPGLRRPAPRLSGRPASRTVLLSGRAEDDRLKGLDIAAAATGRLQVGDLGLRPTLVIRGAAPNDADELASRLIAIAGNAGSVRVRPYTVEQNRLRADFAEAALVVMPSRSEGFGLVAFEAIDAGIPVLVSSSSGVGELLSRHGHLDHVVDIDGDDPTAPDVWAERMRRVLDDPAAAFDQAGRLREALADILDWSASIPAVLEAMDVPASIRERRGRPVPAPLPAATVPFHGRAGELEQVEQLLASRDVTVLSGLGGVGKSRLARRIAERWEHPDAVAWISGRSVATAVEDFAALLGEDRQELSADQVPESAIASLGDEWLLVIDDVVDPDRLAAFLGTRPHRATILVTTQHSGGWSGIGTEHRVEPWARSDSVDFLTRRVEHDPEAAEQLAEALGDLPLALEQAAAYADANLLSLAAYSTRLQEHAPELFEEGRPRDYEHTVASVWNVAHEEISAEPEAAYALEMCGVLAPTAIARRLLAIGDDLLAADRAVRMLAAFSQVTPAGSEHVDIHPLVQTIVRHQLAEDGALETVVVGAAAVALEVAFDDGRLSGEGLQTARELAPHVQALAEHLKDVTNEESDSELNELEAGLCFWLGEHLRVAGQREEALAYLERAAELIDDIGNDEVAVRVLREFGVTLAMSDDAGVRRGAEVLRDAVNRADAARLDNSTRARAYDALGIAELEAGDVEAAERAQRRAWELLGDDGSEDDRQAVAGNLANTLRRAGHLDEAHEFAQLSLDVLERMDGDMRDEIAISQYSLARILAMKGDTDSAWELGYRACCATEDLKGPKHPDVLISWIRLARDRQHLGDHDGAVRAWRAVLRCARAQEDEDSIGRALLDLACALAAGNGHEPLRTVERLCAAQEVLALVESRHGNKDPRIAEPLMVASSAYEAAGLCDRAIDLQQRVVAITNALVEEGQPDAKELRAIANRGLQELLVRIGITGREQAFERASRQRSRDLSEIRPPSDPERLQAAMDLAVYLSEAEDQGRRREALQSLENLFPHIRGLDPLAEGFRGLVLRLIAELRDGMAR